MKVLVGKGATEAALGCLAVLESVEQSLWQPSLLKLMGTFENEGENKHRE